MKKCLTIWNTLKAASTVFSTACEGASCLLNEIVNPEKQTLALGAGLAAVSSSLSTDEANSPETYTKTRNSNPLVRTLMHRSKRTFHRWLLKKKRTTISNFWTNLTPFEVSGFKPAHFSGYCEWFSCGTDAHFTVKKRALYEHRTISLMRHQNSPTLVTTMRTPSSPSKPRSQWQILEHRDSIKSVAWLL